MSIEWEEMEPEPGMAEQLFTGIGDSGETYEVWYGAAFLNPDTAVLRWIAQGWPEYDSDSLPLFDSLEEAQALCERWEAIKVDAEERARAAFTGVRAGQG